MYLVFLGYTNPVLPVSPGGAWDWVGSYGSQLEAEESILNHNDKPAWAHVARLDLDKRLEVVSNLSWDNVRGRRKNFRFTPENGS